MGVRHVCLMCVILWTTFNQIYSAPMPGGKPMSYGDVTGPDINNVVRRRRFVSNSAILFPTEETLLSYGDVTGPEINDATRRRRLVSNSAILFPTEETLLSYGDVTGPEINNVVRRRRLVTNSAILFPTEETLGIRNIFRIGCAGGHARDSNGGCRRAFGAESSPMMLNRIFFL